jgi:uncharacterized membrane protein
MQNLNELKDKIHTLETERLQLRNEIDDLRKAAESRASALEADIHQMHEQIQILRELLIANEDLPFSTKTDNPHSAVPQNLEPSLSSKPILTEAASLNQTLSPSEEEPEKKVETDFERPEILSKPDQKEIYKALLETLSGDERKVVEILIKHNGRYPQKYIRTEAELSWLQTNRTLNRLTERGIVTLEKDGGLGSVVLSQPK